MKKILLLFLGTALFMACDKPEGEGGTSTIQGKIIIRDYNTNFTLLQSTYPAQEERVYIIYGDNNFYDDDTRTSFDGTFKFDNLRKGNYKIFAYSDDSTFTVPGGQYAIIKEVEITEESQTVEIPTIYLLK
jgi:hypothetical protein